MKRMKICLVGILTLMLTLLCFAACGVAGTYKFKSITIMGVSYEAGSQVPGMGAIEEDAYVVELNSDGTAVVTMNMFGQTDSSECAWEEEDGKIIFKEGDVTVATATVEDGVMKLGLEGYATVVLEK